MPRQKKQQKVFYCKNPLHDKYVWETDAYALGEDEKYWAVCPACNTSRMEVDRSFLGLAKAWLVQSGPTTPEGKARSRLNGYKDGRSSKVMHMLAPAFPGRYPECDGCELREECEESFRWCPVIVGPLLRVSQAYAQGRVDEVREIAGYNAAKQYHVLQMMYGRILKEGVLVPKHIRYIDGKDGKIEEVLEWQKNPLLDVIPKYMRDLGHTAEQLAVTPQQQQDQENIEGFLKNEGKKQISLEEQRTKAIKAVADLKMQLQKANLTRQADPALKRHTEQIEHEEITESKDG